MPASARPIASASAVRASGPDSGGN